MTWLPDQQQGRHLSWQSPVQEHISSLQASALLDPVLINSETIELIKARKGGDGTKVINLVKSIEKFAEENSDDPFLIAMAERARLVQESFEQRQTSTSEALEELLAEVRHNEARKKEQAERGFDDLSFFVFQNLEAAQIRHPEEVSSKIKAAFVQFPNWQRSDNELRELRKKVTFAIFAECDQLEQVTPLVEGLFALLLKIDKNG